MPQLSTPAQVTKILRSRHSPALGCSGERRRESEPNTAFEKLTSQRGKAFPGCYHPFKERCLPRGYRAGAGSRGGGRESGEHRGSGAEHSRLPPLGDVKTASGITSTFHCFLLSPSQTDSQVHASKKCPPFPFVFSGGVSRDWTGVPRKLYKPGTKEPHCVCVRTTGPPSDQVLDDPAHRNRGDLDHPNLEEYTGCPPLSMTCSFPL